MIKIIKADDAILEKVIKLVFTVFPAMGLPERLSFWAYKHQRNMFVKILMRLTGISSLLNVWAAIDENDELCGTTGLYTYAKDKHEAVWLFWFCVSPDHRGQGIGEKMLAFSIEQAKCYDKKYLRLYTTDEQYMASAQNLYEKMGFKIKKEKKRRHYTILIKELEL
jgi:GNAT superfamily N-acetyltransferase